MAAFSASLFLAAGFMTGSFFPSHCCPPRQPSSDPSVPWQLVFFLILSVFLTAPAVSVWDGILLAEESEHLPAAVATPKTHVTGMRLFEQFCGECHFHNASEGLIELDLLLLRAAEAAGPPTKHAADHAAWNMVFKQIESEIMPPADQPQPSSEERLGLLAFLNDEVFKIDAKRPDPGHVVLRRHNRIEYSNTVRDLVGLTINTIDDFPADDTGYGFDTNAAVLTLAPLLMEKYIATATLVADAVVNTATPTGKQKDATKYPPSLRTLFPEGRPPENASDRDQYRRRLLEKLAYRAYRQPVDKQTIEKLCALAKASEDAVEGTFEKGVAAALTALLASPRFLFRVEHTETLSPTTDGEKNGTTAVPIDEFALASRLSYLLWSSMPDDALLELAATHRLRATLNEQVDRMIADDRSNEFIRHFIGQWLQTRDVESLPFDIRSVLGISDRAAGEKIFSNDVRRAMRLETELLFGHILRKNLPVTDLLVGEYTFLNTTLAKYYGLQDVTGEAMRLVQLEPESHRSGLLTHGSFLVVTSNPSRTSPVKRGLFVLNNLLGMPAPAAPPDIPPLDASQKKSDGKTMRELMELHRSEALCASCHRRMDPLGLAMEHYNAVGQWRGDEPQEKQSPISTQGQLLTGESFADVRSLATLIVRERRRDFYRCMSEKLLTYALGRGLEYFDAPAIEAIVQGLEADGRMGSVVHGVVASVPFQMRRADAETSAQGPVEQ
ncbi:MAG: DUF1592 domain-containing protein [Planctomycetia bacterium]|nr:DUF1592 domain-containing protein [Planctomycetia bacterium]